MKKKYHNRLLDFKNTFTRIYSYCISGVWSDTRHRYSTDVIKTINLTVNSFLDKNFQQKAAALTYNTILAFIPALALLFAIGRGFGFQNLLQSELFKYFPAQKTALTKAFAFVDSYLAQSSQGIFLGIGIVFLFWTLISLFMNMEAAFNEVWGVRNGRNVYRKVSDYTAMLLILPVLMICEGGVSIFMSALSNASTLFSPVMKVVMDIIPVVLTWLFFTAAFILIPNTKVKFKYAIIPGILCGITFQLLQWLFVSGQIYVSKYNAIYGSFAFLPLLLIWLQLSWLITLAGAGLTYSAQSFFNFNFQQQIKNISTRYLDEISIIVMALIIKNYEAEKPPYSERQLSAKCDLPIRLVNKIIANLYDSGLIVALQDNNEGYSTYIPAIDMNRISLDYFFNKTRTKGESNFLNDFDRTFKNSFIFIQEKRLDRNENYRNILLKDLPLPDMKD